MIDKYNSQGEQVTPLLGSNPERSYKRTGNIISCFAVISHSGEIENTIVLSKEPIFSLEMPTAEIATTLMNDLYYGEYTGA